ncbi:MAG TPA: shikimate dehydrogenase [Ignavibacteriaceae bacterium]|nr:shikimate dehydrogenase [Ignavibacteriaceae bacterium]
MKNSLHNNTKLLGLIGHPIKQSYSPLIHNIASEMLGLEYIYLPFDVPSSSLKNAIKGMVALGIKGFNVTIPHKESILGYMNNLSEEASIIGSINTIVNDMGKLVGYNTDAAGIIETLLPFIESLTGNEVTVLGSGGSARAVIYVLIRYIKPSRINIVNRTEQRAETIRSYFSEKMKYDQFKVYELFPPELLDVLKNSAAIINATSVGMFPEIDDSIITQSSVFVKEQLVFDLIYNPTKTKLLKLAESEGAIAVNGIKTLVYQAAKSFELWTNHEMPVDKISDVITAYLNT